MDATQERMDAESLMADHSGGLTVMVYSSPSDTVGRECPAIASYGDIKVGNAPRGELPSTVVSLYNSTADGLSVDEWTPHCEVALPKAPGSSQIVRKRVIRRLRGTNQALIRWELG